MRTTAALLFGFVLLFNTTARAQAPDSCLKLWCVDRMQMGEYSECRNADSVLVDSCESSATYLQLYANRWFKIIFHEDYFQLPAVAEDSILSVDWRSLGDTASDVRDVFASLYSQFGPVYLQKTFPEAGPEFPASRQYRMRVERYAPVDSILIPLRTAVTSASFVSEPRISLGINSEHPPTENTICWPNPAKNRLYFHSEMLVSNEITIRNTEGRVVEFLTLDESAPIATISIATLPAGTYFIYSAEKFCFKFVKS